MTGHSHLQDSSTFSAKVGKLAEAQLVASVVLLELLEELVPPLCESDDELEYIATLLLEMERTSATRVKAILRMSSLICQTASLKKNSNEKKYVCG